MTRLLSLLFLSVLLVASTSTATAINQNDVLKAVSNQPDPETQIEPSTGETDTENADKDGSNDDDKNPGVRVEENDKDKYDIDFKVTRPTKPPAKGCDDDDDKDGVKCEKKVLEPYKKWPSYKTWRKTKTPLFILIFGGLRWDYLTKSESNMTGKTVGAMKAFNWIKKHGVTISQVNPVFPPHDLPVWTSMATGLYPKSHGVNGDFMFNINTREMFKRGIDGNLDTWWKQGVPIWSLAAASGKKVSSLNWHDCTIGNIETPNDCKPFIPPNSNQSKLIPPASAIGTMFNQAFTKIHKDKYDLSIVYTDVLKKAARANGANSELVMDTLATLDAELQTRLSDIRTKKDKAGLSMNVMVLSDYGFMDDTATTKLQLEEYVNFDHCQLVLQRGGSVVLVPYAQKVGDIMGGVGHYEGAAKMEGVDAYVRDVNLEMSDNGSPLDYPEIPEDLNYAGLLWTQDILLVAKPGFEIVLNNSLHEGSTKVYPPVNDHRSSSGYHPNPSPPYQPGKDKHKSKAQRKTEKKERELYSGFAHMMKTVGFAWGPDFKSGYESGPIEAVDLYQLMCFLLQIKPNHHDGDWSRVRPMLTISSANSPSPSVVATTILALATLWSRSYFC